MSSDHVELNFRLSVNDYMALSYAMGRSVAERLYIVILAVGVGALGVGLGLILHKWVWVGALGFADSSNSVQGAVLLGMLATCAAVVIGFLPWYWRSAFHGAERLWKVKFVANENGIDASYGPMRTSAPWSVFTRVHATSKHLFLFIAPRQAHIVPRSAFASAADEQALYAWARAGAPHAAFTGNGPT